MKKILIIGASSKIAKRLIALLDGSYELTITSRLTADSRGSSCTTTVLDLLDEVAVQNFITQHKETRYIGVLVFSATYESDSDSAPGYYAQMMRDLTINSLAPMTILRSISYDEGARVFLFSDAGLAHPKHRFTSYAASKALLEQQSRSLAVELAPSGASVITFALGPTYPQSTKAEEIIQYRKRCLITVDDPTKGLVELIRFILETPNINITGTTIQYDGGAYLKRVA